MAVPYCGGRDPRCLDWGPCIARNRSSISTAEHIRRKRLLGLERAGKSRPALRQSCDAHPWPRPCSHAAMLAEAKTIQYSPREQTCRDTSLEPGNAGRKQDGRTSGLATQIQGSQQQPASHTSSVVSSRGPSALSFAARQAANQPASQPDSLQYTKHGSLHSQLRRAAVTKRLEESRMTPS